MALDQLSLRCDCTPVVDLEFDVDDTTPSEAVVDAVAAVSGTEPEDLPPLYDSIDPDALDQLFRRRTGDPGPSETVLSFALGDWNVFVSHGRVRVCDPSGPDDPSPVFG